LDTKKIGVFDSGVGGLTVVREIMHQLPQETIYYFGDTARCPYGPRSREEVEQFAFEIIEFLLQFPLKAIVIACNTATAAALEKAKKQVPIPVLGVIEPGARAALKATRNGRIGVIGTQGTIQSGAYERTLKQMDPGISVYSLACPRFVPLVESGSYQTPLADQIVAEELAPLRQEKIDTLILGCTHYPLLTGSIAKPLGNEVKLISSAEETASELKQILMQNGALSAQLESHRFFTTGTIDTFRRVAKEWLQKEIEVEQVELTYIG
jgi:glutamate racemase